MASVIVGYIWIEHQWYKLKIFVVIFYLFIWVLDPIATSNGWYQALQISVGPRATKAHWVDHLKIFKYLFDLSAARYFFIKFVIFGKIVTSAVILERVIFKGTKTHWVNILKNYEYKFERI